MTTFGWGLIGPGRIAHRFAGAVQGTHGMRLSVVQGRDRERSATFAQKWAGDGSPAAVVGSIEELARDERVDGVYVATPHAFHAEQCGCASPRGNPCCARSRSSRTSRAAGRSWRWRAAGAYS
jgi:predicted dehydrogenase